MPRYKLGQAPADASIRNGKYRKTVDIPVEYLDALNALAKADNRDLKNYFETEIIKLAVGYIEANAGLKIRFQPENANTGPSTINAKGGKATSRPIQTNSTLITPKEDGARDKAKSSFLDGRRKQKGITS